MIADLRRGPERRHPLPVVTRKAAFAHERDGYFSGSPKVARCRWGPSPRGRSAGSSGVAMTDRDVQIRVGSKDVIHGDLALPDDATGLVVFAHGSGSSRPSPRN